MMGIMWLVAAPSVRRKRRIRVLECVSNKDPFHLQHALTVETVMKWYAKKLGYAADELTGLIGAATMSLSSFCVVSNARRLNWVKLEQDNRNFTGAKKDIKRKVETNMTKTIQIEGMMCAHCEARIKKVLEGLEGVVSVQVSHEAGNAIVTLDKDIPDSLLKETITAQDYKVLSIE